MKKLLSITLAVCLVLAAAQLPVMAETNDPLIGDNDGLYNPEWSDPNDTTPEEPGTLEEQKAVLTVDGLTMNRIFDSGWVGEAIFATPENLFDGDPTTYSDWDQYKDDGATADCLAEFIIDLGAAKNLSKVSVYTGVAGFGSDGWSWAAPMNAEIKVSANGENWTSVYSYDSDTVEATRLDEVVLDPAGNGAGVQYVMYTFNKVARRVTISEIEVYEMVAGEGGEPTDPEDPEEPVDPEEPGAEILYGDANGDDIVDGRDVIHLSQYLANYDFDTESSTVEIAEGANANGDNTVDGRDVIILCQYFANYDYDTNSSTVVLGPRQ